MACVICLRGETGNGSFITTQCQHTFHYECLNQWARQGSAGRARNSRFCALGLLPKDAMPGCVCPVCRQVVQSFQSSGKVLHRILYNYDGNPYHLQPGHMVYYYYALRQPGGPRAGYIGQIQTSSAPGSFDILCLWPEKKTHAQVPAYTVFDILFLALPGKIPTRSQVNTYYVPDHLSRGLVTEVCASWAPPFTEEDMQALKPYLVAHLAHAKPSPLSPEIYSISFFLQVHVWNALHGDGSPETPETQLLFPKYAPHSIQCPIPDADLKFTEATFQALQNAAIGLNQARIIWRYWNDYGSWADVEDSPRAIAIILGGAIKVPKESPPISLALAS